ncbi:diguanylate cyclase [Lactobacillaceae bacterium L1_55_11]|nr:diguanylate cyclase [Lactobacillaceae bacterium L1_55_11]
MQVTIFGKGNMAKAIGQNLEAGSNQVSYYDSKETASALGDLVVMAVPYPAEAALVKQYGDQLAGKVVVEIANPLDFQTFDSLVVPADSSAAQLLQEQLPQAKVVKAFNTNFAASLLTGKVGAETTTVLAASDDAQAKATLKEALSGSPLGFLDAGALKRARELEAMGFLQMTLAVNKQIGWTGGFGVVK